jgi:hypothetical protein
MYPQIPNLRKRFRIATGLGGEEMTKEEGV